MAGVYGFFNNGSNGETTMQDEDFDEEDVWNVMKESPKFKHSNDTFSVSSTPKPCPAAPNLVPKPNGSSSSKFVQQSAPVKVLDWSKMKVGSWDDGSFECGDDDDVGGGAAAAYGDDDDEDYETKIPPHEWLAKKLEKSQISSFSVCEGVGRKLKGRDLSKMRDAILTRTGFLE